MIEYRLKKSSPGLQYRLGSSAVHAEPCFDERADEPRPHGPLMVGAVALAHPALVVRDIAGRARRERAQAERRPEARLDSCDYLRGAFAIQKRNGKTANGEYLIGTKRGIDGAALMVAVNHIVKTTVPLVPKTRTERFKCSFEYRLPFG